MALLKWLKERLADGAPVWEGIYDNAIRNRLRRDKNLADLTDRAEARKNLDLVGEVETHWHDSRYMPHINKLRKDADDLRTDLTNDEKIISNNVKRLDGHDQDIKQLQDRATKVENRATALESRATAVESRATNLEKNVSNLQGKTSTLETEMTGTKGRVTTLEGDVSALKTARTNLESETASLKTRTSGLETRMGQAEKDISNLKSSTDTLKSKTDGLTTKTTNLETRCGIIEGSNSKLETRCSTIEGNANQLAGRVSSLEKKTWIENAGHATTADTATNANAAKSANTADSATKAVNDGDNRNIVNTYATKTELNAQKNRLDGKEFVKNDTASKRISLKYETENGKNVVAPYVDGVKVPLSTLGLVSVVNSIVKGTITGIYFEFHYYEEYGGASSQTWHRSSSSTVNGLYIKTPLGERLIKFMSAGSIPTHGGIGGYTIDTFKQYSPTFAIIREAELAGLNAKTSYNHNEDAASCYGWWKF